MLRTTIDPATSGVGSVTEVVATRLASEEKTRALQNAILSSANFSIIATDADGVIQLFNVGAEHMLGYAAAEVVNSRTPSDFHDPQDIIARAEALSLELETPIAPGFQALAFKASRGIEDIYELTYLRKDGSRFPAVVSITALRDEYSEVIGYLLIGSHNSVRIRVERELNDAMAAADQANRAKSDFLSNMSHELRPPRCHPRFRAAARIWLAFANRVSEAKPRPDPEGWMVPARSDQRDIRPSADRIRKAFAIPRAAVACGGIAGKPSHDRAAGAKARD